MIKKPGAKDGIKVIYYSGHNIKMSDEMRL